MGLLLMGQRLEPLLHLPGEFVVLLQQGVVELTPVGLQLVVAEVHPALTIASLTLVFTQVS